MDEASLAAYLSCDVNSLVKLSLTLRPRQDPGLFAADIREIASHAGLDRTRLASLVRRVEFLESLEQRGERQTPILLAARDRDEDEA